MTETGARTVSAVGLGIVAVFLVVVVVAGLSTSGFQTSAGATAAAAQGSAAAGGAPGAGDPVHGKQLFQQFNCSACHSVNGSPGVGPTLKGVAGSQVPLTDGTMVVADDTYLKVSIQNPDQQIVMGYMPGTMASAIMAYQSQLHQDSVVNDLIAYIKTLK